MTELPAEIAAGAIFQGNEYAWPVFLLLETLHRAEAIGYACLGGQFQFRTVQGISEMYWLNADASDRSHEESWQDYCRRSCLEVSQRFREIMSATDFKLEARRWPALSEQVKADFDPLSGLVFVAYFVQESESAAMRKGES